MSIIDPAKAVDVVTLLEDAIRGADPEFKPARSTSIKTTLGALAPTREHSAAAMAKGQNVAGMLATARRQIAELAILIKTIAASAPAGDTNAANFSNIISGLSE